MVCHVVASAVNRGDHPRKRSFGDNCVPKLQFGNEEEGLKFAAPAAP